MELSDYLNNCRSGDIEKVSEYIKKDKTFPIERIKNYKELYDEGFLWACCDDNNVSFLKYMINNFPVDVSEGFKFSCEKGNIVNVEYLLSLKLSKDLVNQGFVYSCRSGNLDLVKLFTIVDKKLLRDGFKESCFEGHLHIIEYLSTRVDKEHYNSGLISACKGNNIDAVKYLVSIGANKFNLALEFFSEMSNPSIEIADYLLSMGADSYKDIFIIACSNGNLERAKSAFELTKGYKGNVYRALSLACRSGNLELVKYVISILLLDRPNKTVHHMELICAYRISSELGYTHIVDYLNTIEIHA